MADEFGLLKLHGGAPAGGNLDSITITFSLIPTGTPVPPVTVNLASFSVDSSGVGGVALSDYAQQGGAVVTLTSGNPTVLAVPASITVPQGRGYPAPSPLASQMSTHQRP